MAEQTVIRLRRRETSIPWGFRMQGGREFGNCLYIQKITSKSVAAKCGLLPGDGILMIGNTPANYMSHEQAKMEIIRAGNELDLVVQRNAIDVGQDEVDTASSSGTRSQVSEETSEYRGYTNPSVQSRSFKILQASLNYSEASGATACQPVESYLFRYEDIYAPLIDKYREAQENERDRKTSMLQNTIMQERGRSGQTRNVTRLDEGSGRLDASGHSENRTEMIRYMVDTERNNVEDKLTMLKQISKNNSSDKPITISPEKTMSIRQDVVDNRHMQMNQDVTQTEGMGVENKGYVNIDVRTFCFPEKQQRDEKNVMIDSRSAQVHQNVTQCQEVVDGSYMRQELGPVVRAQTTQGTCFEVNLAQTQVKEFQAPTRPVQTDARQVEVKESQASEAEQSLASKVIQCKTQGTVSDAVKSKAGSASIQYQTSEVEQTYNSANTMLLENKTNVETKMVQRTNNETTVQPVNSYKFMSGREEVRENKNTETSVERQNMVQVESIDVKVDASTKHVEDMATKKAVEIIESAKCTIRAETKQTERKHTEQLNLLASVSENEMFKTDSAEAEIALEFVTTNRERINTKPAVEQGQMEINETQADELQKTIQPETYIIKSEGMTSILDTETAKSTDERSKSTKEETKLDSKTVWLETEAAKSVTWAVQDETDAANLVTCAVQDENETASSVTWAVQNETEIVDSETCAVQNKTETAKSVTRTVQDETETAKSVTRTVQDETETASSVTWGVQNDTETVDSATWAVQTKAGSAKSVNSAVQNDTETAKSIIWAVQNETERASEATWAVQDETETANSVTWAVNDETETAHSVTWALQNETDTANSVTWALQNETETANSATWALQSETETAISATWAVEDETETANSATHAVQDETEGANSVTWAVQNETVTLKADTDNKLITGACKSEIEREMNDTVTEGKYTTSKRKDDVTEVSEKVEISTEIAVADGSRIERSKILARKTEIVRDFSYDEDDESYETWTEEESDNDVDIEETISKELETSREET
ncbi:hypothetical protein ACJMK2_034398 [Sinanodonta woodiana]|uniref:PDZ domain-containing protein n=1 Tax=Sinanodonta woodiana TaxID=1069815 RepID=A0ABD3WRE6_SINWO